MDSNLIKEQCKASRFFCGTLADPGKAVREPPRKV